MKTLRRSKDEAPDGRRRSSGFSKAESVGDRCEQLSLEAVGWILVPEGSQNSDAEELTASDDFVSKKEAIFVTQRTSL